MIIDKSNEISPLAIIEDEVIIGKGNIIQPYAVLRNGTRLGNNNIIHSFAILGAEPQIPGAANFGRLIIGNNNVFREHCIVQKGSGLGRYTNIGSYNIFYCASHISHDCSIGDYNLMVNNSVIAGGSVIRNYTEVYGYSAISNKVVLHDYALLAGHSSVRSSVLPYCKVSGRPARIIGYNFARVPDSETKSLIKKVYRIVFSSSLTKEEAIKQIRETYPDNVIATNIADTLETSLKICRPRNNGN